MSSTADLLVLLLDKVEQDAEITEFYRNELIKDIKMLLDYLDE